MSILPTLKPSANQTIDYRKVHMLCFFIAFRGINFSIIAIESLKTQHMFSSIHRMSDCVDPKMSTSAKCDRRRCDVVRKMIKRVCFEVTFFENNLIFEFFGARTKKNQRLHL
jgi:hypothetical protein